jgi:hypothetical protein
MTEHVTGPHTPEVYAGVNTELLGEHTPVGFTLPTELFLRLCDIAAATGDSLGNIVEKAFAKYTDGDQIAKVERPRKGESRLHMSNLTTMALAERAMALADAHNCNAVDLPYRHLPPVQSSTLSHQKENENCEITSMQQRPHRLTRKMLKR